ncbi:unnamed protein product, partial [Nippostrongylus brasiliensis]|uniref:Flocculation protein FLO11 n=1 Tax=Nippostrongylus brasiliensis TaxID=27835 RepID=A0A0N4XF85_NIPBR
MVRVRACSTVRGYKCIGHNKEFQSCDSSHAHLSATGDAPKTEPSRSSPDIDVVDPYSEDRRIAMKQLYQDYEVEVPEEEKVSPKPRFRPASPGPARDPIVVAQYAQRFPQPENERIEIWTSDVDNVAELSQKPVTPRTVATRPVVPFRTTKQPSTTPRPASTTAPTTSTTTEATTTTPEPTTTVVEEEEEVTEAEEMHTTPTPPMQRSHRVESNITLKTIEEKKPNDGRTALSPSGEKEYHWSDDDDDESEYDNKQILDAFNAITRPVIISTSSPTTTSTLPSTSPDPILVKTTSSRTAVNMMAPAVFIGSPRLGTAFASKPVGTVRPQLEFLTTTASPIHHKPKSRGKQRRLRKLKMLNRRARVKPYSMKPPGNVTVQTINSETRTALEMQKIELAKQIQEKKEQLAGILKMSSTTHSPEEIEGDTAKALSWMFANVAKLMNEKTKSEGTTELKPSKKVDNDASQSLSRLPQGVEVISEQESFVLKDDASSDPVIKVDRPAVDGSASLNNGNVEWSDWSTCNCGVQSRKTVCLSVNISRVPAKYSSDYRQRQRRSASFCPPSEYETRPCKSD